MIPGFNARVVRGGIEYHVQTEDLGDKAACILTLVYRGGAIVSREKVEYGAVSGGQPVPSRITALMEDQHRRALRRVSDGAFEPPPAIPPPAEPRSVDDLIAEYLRRRRERRAG